MFDPQTKKNQHFVPAFWQRRFGSGDGTVWALQDKVIAKKSPKKLMSGDWIYTVFDAGGRPSNALENWASMLEGRAARVMAALDVPNSCGSIEEQIFLRYFMAFSACRHPDVMGQGHRRTKQLTYGIVDAAFVPLEEFQASVTQFGIGSEAARQLHALVREIPLDDLLIQLDDVVSRQPNDSLLPAQLAIDPETIERAFFNLAKHSITVLDCPVGANFILGDTPFPATLGGSFTIPLSPLLALLWVPGAVEMLPDWTRRMATQAEVEATNRAQADNALKTLIGASEQVLVPYAV